METWTPVEMEESGQKWTSSRYNLRVRQKEFADILDVQLQERK